MNRKLSISINANLVDKHVGGNKLFFSEGWRSVELTAEALAAEINRGFAFGPQFRSGIRKGVNFERTSYIALDADGSLSLEDALKDQFVRDFAAIWYFTPSHGEEGLDRFRILFTLEEPIDRAEDYKLALLGLAIKFGTDAKVADASRAFFGCRGSQPTVLGGVLPKNELKALIKIGRGADRKKSEARLVDDNASPAEAQFLDGPRQGKAFPSDLPIRSVKSGTEVVSALPAGSIVHCPFHDDKRPSAFVVRSRTGSQGIYCSSCRETRWPTDAKRLSYDFNFYEKMVVEQAKKRERINAQLECDGEPISNKQALVINEPYLPALELQKGFTLVKSPKGSGKTTALVKLVEKARLQTLSVLLIGHRQVLLRELARKLGLHCYLDDLKGENEQSALDYYALCLNSLPTRLRGARSYHIVIVDECEQVFSNIIAKTMKSPHAVMTLLQCYVREAQSLYLLDADLNRVTLNFVATARKNDFKQPATLILNTYTGEERVCQIFPTPDELLLDMLRNVKAGKRIYVACNSKRKATVLAKMLEKHLGSDGRILLITADTKTEKEVQQFLADIPAEALRYRAIVASPAIGTGIDITFPEQAREIDIAYGWFLPGINSHYDVDQQLGRVRHPGEVKVWISGMTNSFEIEPDAVKRDLIKSGDGHPAILSVENGMPIIDMDHPLLQLQASAYCAQRASQNHLKKHFLQHKNKCGWKIVWIDGECSPQSRELKARLRQLEAEVEQEYVGAVLNADLIDERTWEAYFRRKALGEPLSFLARHEMVKFEIFNFYGEQVTRDLIRLDDRARFREVLSNYEQLNVHNGQYLSLLLRQWGRFCSGQDDFATAFGFGPLRSLEAIMLSAGLIDSTGLCREKIVSKGMLAHFLEFSRKNRVLIERDLNIAFRGDFERDPVRMLNLFIGKAGLQLEKVRKTRHGEDSVYEYRMDFERLSLLEKIRVRRREGGRSILPESLEPPRLPANPPSTRQASHDPFTTLLAG